MTEQIHNSNSSRAISLERASFFVILFVSFFVPIFFLPVFGLFVGEPKGALIILGTILAFILWLIGRAKKGDMALPKSSSLAALLGVVIVIFLSSLLSPIPKVSLFGIGSETGTFLMILALFILTFLITQLCRSMDRILYLYMSFFMSTILVALFEVIRIIFGANFLTLGVFNSLTASPVGTFGNMSLFFAILAILSLSTISLLKLKKTILLFLSATIGISIFFLALTDVTISWAVLACASFAVIIYKLFLLHRGSGEDGATSHRAKINLSFATPILVLIISSTFLFSGSAGQWLSRTLNISNVEARPSFNTTIELTKNIFMSGDAFWGIGPNRFVQEWLMHKPSDVNNTAFWNAEFDSGAGVIPTFAITAGIAGIVSWIIFLLIFLSRGTVGVIRSARDELTQFMTLSSFLVAISLWAFAVFCVPNIVMFFMAFLFTGLNIASLINSGVVKTVSVQSNKTLLSFVVTPLIGILIMASFVGEYMFASRFAASFYREKGVEAFMVLGDIDKAEKYITRSAKLYAHDSYYRALAWIKTIKLRSILEQSETSEDIDALRLVFQTTLAEALESGKKAIDFDESNYANWVSVGEVYEIIVPTKIAGAYENALSHYTYALELNPSSPMINLMLARLEIANGDKENARKYLNSALALKKDYAEALIWLYKIEADAGNVSAAIEKAEKAAMSAPNDADVFFHLGVLQYQEKNYEKAIYVLERAVTLNPVYANAKYFLALSYEEVGRTGDALKQMEDVLYLNPDNEEARRAVKELKEGNLVVEDDDLIEVTPDDNADEDIESVM